MPSDEAVEGMQDLLTALGETALNLGQKRKLIAKGLRKASKPIAVRGAERAPDDPKTPGSRVAKNITTSVVNQTATSGEAQTGPVGAGFPGVFAETGTANQQATPFLGPAFDETEEQAYDILDEVIGGGIEESYRG